MKRSLEYLRRYFPLLLGAAIVGWGIWYVSSHPAEISAIRTLAPQRLLFLFGLSTVKLASMGLFTRIIVASLGVDLGFLEWFGLSAMSAMGNYLTPFRGGAAVRAVYLKSRHDLSYARFLSTLSMLYVLTFATSAGLGTVASLTLYLRYGLLDGRMVLVFLLLLLLPTLLFPAIRLLPRRFLTSLRDSPEKGSNSWLNRILERVMGVLDNVVEGWRIVSAAPQTLVLLVLASLFNASVTLMMIHFSFSAFAEGLPLVESLVLSSLFMISSMIPLTPSGLGVAELILVLVSEGFIDDGSLSVLAAGLNRTVMILSSVAWGGLFSYVLGRRQRTER